MGERLSDRIAAIAPSATLAVDAKAKALKAAGEPVIGFGAGEPDFPTPAHIVEAAVEACRDPKNHRYTPAAGLPELREAVAAKTERDSQYTVAPSQVVITNGGKQALYNTFAALLDPGDEALLPAPYWTTYPESIRLAGGVPVEIHTDETTGYRVSLEQLEAALTPRTKLLVFVSPSNPTGAVYTPAQIAALAEVAVEKNLLIISDDIYRSLCYGDATYQSIAALGPELAARTILVDGVSKTYAMTGWRIGYAAGPAPIIKAMAKVQGQSTSNPTHLAQIATVAALTGPQECVATMRAAFDERRKAIVALLRAIPGVACREPKGAFYAFPDLGAFIGRHNGEGQPIKDDVALCDWLVEHARVAVVPGSGFGAAGHVRLSYACSMDNIKLGLGRLREALLSLR